MSRGYSGGAVAATTTTQRTWPGAGERDYANRAAPPPMRPSRGVRSKHAPSLGTTAMSQATLNSKASSDSGLSMSEAGDGLGITMNIPQPILRHHKHTPPPTAPIREARATRLIRLKAKPVERLPPLPTTTLSVPPPPPEMPSPTVSPTRTCSTRRKTILQRIEGWWDLGLLERRQTVVGRKASSRTDVSEKDKVMRTKSLRNRQ